MPIAHVPRRRHSITRSSATAARSSRCSRAAGGPARRCARWPQKIAEAGNRVVIYDRRNTGASSIAIEGESENEEWADDLHELLREIDALPAFVGGSSSGCRLALILALRRPEAVRGLLLWRVTGGAHAAEQLTNQYYTSHIEAAQQGGMAAVCRLDHWSEVIGINPKARDALMAMDPQDFIARMDRWRQSFLAGADHPVIGLSPAELRAHDDAGLHRAGHGPGASARRRSGGAPADAERRIRRGRDRNAGDARRRLRRLGGARGAARGALYRLPAPARAAVADREAARSPVAE